MTLLYVTQALLGDVYGLTLRDRGCDGGRVWPYYRDKGSDGRRLSPYSTITECRHCMC